MSILELDIFDSFYSPKSVDKGRIYYYYLTTRDIELPRYKLELPFILLNFLPDFL